MVTRKRKQSKSGLNASRVLGPVKRYWQKSLFHRLLMCFFAFLIIFAALNYAVAQWYIARHAKEPLVYGVTFVPDYARYYDLDPREVLNALIHDLRLKQIRLVSYWDDIESSPGNYDFTELDWQFAMAKTAGVKVSLAIGLRQPRWPECHIPSWAEIKSKPEWVANLKTFMTKVIERYKDNSVLDSYQLENEFFLKVFGLCTDFDRKRL